MGKLILALIFVLLTAFSAFAGGYEAVEIAGSSTALTAATYGRARSALCRLETAPIRYTINGSTTPTSSVGIIVYPLEWVILESANDIRNFRGIRTTDTSGSLKCFYID
jgi:hypothetical protein